MYAPKKISITINKDGSYTLPPELLAINPNFSLEPILQDGKIKINNPFMNIGCSLSSDRPCLKLAPIEKRINIEDDMLYYDFSEVDYTNYFGQTSIDAELYFDFYRYPNNDNEVNQIKHYINEANTQFLENHPTNTHDSETLTTDLQFKRMPDYWIKQITVGNGVRSHFVELFTALLGYFNETPLSILCELLLNNHVKDEMYHIMYVETADFSVSTYDLLESLEVRPQENSTQIIQVMVDNPLSGDKLSYFLNIVTQIVDIVNTSDRFILDINIGVLFDDNRVSIYGYKGKYNFVISRATMADKDLETIASVLSLPNLKDRIESVSYRDTDSNGSYFNIVNNTFYLNPNYPTSTIEDWFESETLIFIAENEVDGTGEYIALNPNDGIVDDFKTVIANIIPYNIEHLDCFPTKITTNNYKDYSYAPTPNEVNSITGSFIHSVEFGDILDYVEYKLVNHNGGVYLDIANGYVDMGMFNWVLDDGRTIKEAYPDIVEDLLQMVSLHSFEKDEEGNAIEDIDNALDGNATLIALTNDTVRNVTTPSLNIVKGESFEGSEQDFNELKDYMTTPNVTFTDSVALPISIGGSGTQSISTQGGFTLNKDYPRSSNNTTVNDSNDSLIEQVNNGIGGVVSDEQQLQNIFNAEKVLRDGKLIFNEKDVHADSVGFTYLYGVALPPSETPFIKNFVDGLDTTLTTLLKSSRTSAYLSTQTANEVASGLITYWVTSRFNDQSFTPELREFYGEVTDADGNSDGNTYIKIYDDNSLDDDGLPAELYSFMHKERIDNTPILSSEYLEEQEKKETEFEINFVFTKNDDGSVTITFTKHPDAPDDYYDYLVFDGKKMKVTKEATDG